MAYRKPKPEAEVEIWRAVPVFVGYEASTFGRVRRWDAKKGEWKMLKLTRQPHGYRSVCMRTSEGSKELGVHRIICRTFRGPRPSKDHEVAHNNGNPSDNRLINLRWATRAENLGDTHRHGTRVSKLEEMDVDKIRYIYKDMPQKDIAAMFGVSIATISSILRGRSWKGALPENLR